MSRLGIGATFAAASAVVATILMGVQPASAAPTTKCPPGMEVPGTDQCFGAISGPTGTNSNDDNGSGHHYGDGGLVKRIVPTCKQDGHYEVCQEARNAVLNELAGFIVGNLCGAAGPQVETQCAIALQFDKEKNEQALERYEELKKW